MVALISLFQLTGAERGMIESSQFRIGAIIPTLTTAKTRWKFARELVINCAFIVSSRNNSALQEAYYCTEIPSFGTPCVAFLNASIIYPSFLAVDVTVSTGIAD